MKVTIREKRAESKVIEITGKVLEMNTDSSLSCVLMMSRWMGYFDIDGVITFMPRRKGCLYHELKEK